MLDYLAVAFRHPTGSWAAVMPDFIGVTGRGSDASAAIQEAKAGADAMLSVLKEIPTFIPAPMDILAAQRNPILAKDYGVDWSSAIVDTVSLEADPEPDTPSPNAFIGPETGANNRPGRRSNASSKTDAALRQRSDNGSDRAELIQREPDRKAARRKNEIGEYAATD